MDDNDSEKGGSFSIGMMAGFLWAITIYSYAWFGYEHFLIFLLLLAAFFTKVGLEGSNIGGNR